MNELTKGEQMLVALGYEKNEFSFCQKTETFGVKQITFLNNERYIVTYMCGLSLIYTTTVTIEEHKAIHQILIDYGWLKEDE